MTSLRIISYQDASGNVEVLRVTDDHPFWVEGLGWMSASDLQTGNVVTTPTGGTAIVVGNVAELLETPILVYNLEVASGHTYFVEDGQGLQTPVWVHNKCDLRESVSGPSGRESTWKYLKNSWSGSTFGNWYNSMTYHVAKHGKGLSALKYTKSAMALLKDTSAVHRNALDALGRAAIRIEGKAGVGLFRNGRIIWFHPNI